MQRSSDFDNYATFLGDPQLMSGLRNTIIYAVLTSGLKVIISLPLAMLLTSSIRLKGLFRGIIFFPVLVSTVAVGITFATLMQPSVGLINTALGSLGLPQPDWLGNPSLALYSVALVDVWKGVGIATVIFIAGIMSIPLDYFEAARLEGGTWVKFRHVIIPLARNATFTVILLSFIGGLRIIRPDLDHDTRRSRLCIGRAHVGDLQGVSGRVLWLVDRWQCRALHSRHDHRVSADAVLQSSWSLSYEESGSSLRAIWVDAVCAHRHRHRLCRAVRVHLADCCQDAPGGCPLRVQLAEPSFSCSRTSGTSWRLATTVCSWRCGTARS